MQRASLTITVVASLLLLRQPASLFAAGEAKVFRAGAATSNITPPIGGGIVGGFHPVPSTHVHDELQARCLVLDNGQVKLAIVICDLLGASREMYDEARRWVNEETGIRPEHLLMSSTHTHSAVSALGANRFRIQQELDEYQTFVARRIVDGVRRANHNLAEAKIGWTVALEPRQVFNRRWFMKPGTVPPNPFGEIDQVKMNPARGSPNLVEPAGPTDPEINLLSIQSPKGQPIAVLANYSLHYVGGVPEGHISADYFPLFCDRVQQLLGADRLDPPFVAMLTNGTSGNINNIDFTKPDEKIQPYVKMRQVADDVARAACEALGSVEYREWIPLGGELEELPVKTRRPSAERLEWANKVLASVKMDGHKSTLEEIYAERVMRLNEYPPTIAIPIQALRVGDVGIAGIPCEVFVEIGLELKQQVPLKPAFTISIANGYFGYLPTPEHHRLGGYETWLGTNRLEVQASNLIVAELLEMFDRLK